MASAMASASRRFFSVSPMYLLYSAAKSSRSRGRPQRPATARAARLLPEPCTPASSTPLGASARTAIVERRLALLQPALEARQPAELGKAGGILLEAQYPLHVEQAELGLIEHRQVFLGDGAVVDDQLARQQPRLLVGDTTQVAHHLLQGAVVGTHPAALVASGPARRLLADDGRQLLVRGHAQTDARRQTAQLRRQWQFMTDQQQGRRLLLR